MEEDLKKLKSYLVDSIITLGHYDVRYPVQLEKFMKLSVDDLIKMHEQLNKEYINNLHTSYKNDINRLRAALPWGDVMQMEVDKINELGSHLK